MKSLAFGKKVFIWLCIAPIRGTIGKRERFCHICLSLTVVVTILSAFTSSIVFFKTFISINLNESLYAAFQVAGCFSILSMYLSAFLLRQKINGIFERLQEIYDSNERSSAFYYLTRTNATCERIWKMYFTLALGIFLFNTIALSVTSVLSCLLMRGTFDRKYLYAAYKAVLPWNQRTPLGYVYEMCYDIMYGEAYLIFNGALLMLFVSVSLHHKAFSNMFQHSLNQLENTHRIQNYRKILQHSIGFQNTAKQFFTASAIVYSPIVFIQLICSMIFMACVIFLMDLQIRHIDLEMMMLLMTLAVGVANLLVYCYYGKVATESYLEMGDHAFDLNWQRLPLSLQKYFILIIASSQRPLFYHGFKLKFLTLETFTQMINTVFSYYMMMKSIISY